MCAARYENPQLKPFFCERTTVSESPNAKYAVYYALINSSGLAKLPRIYLTTTITSGGYKIFETKPETRIKTTLDPNFFDRLLVEEAGVQPKKTLPENNLNFGQILEKNVQLAEVFRQALLDSGKVSTEDSLLIFPPNLGKVPGWTQLDFNFFWLDIIAGLKPEDAKKLELELRPQINAEEYNSHSLPAEIRMKSYLKFVQGFLRIIQQNKMEINPVSKLIQLVDPKSSLGCIIEELLARGLGIPVSQVVINNMSSFSNQQELSRLIRQGVDIPASRLSDDQNDPLLLVTQLPLI